jgi:hypothetical protein
MLSKRYAFVHQNDLIGRQVGGLDGARQDTLDILVSGNMWLALRLKELDVEGFQSTRL